MKYRIYFIAIFLLLFTNTTSSQEQDLVVATIGGTPVFQSEFDYAYNKNGTSNSQIPEQFLESYIDFKLTVLEAKNKGINETSEFKEEYKKSIDQMMNDYIKDSIFNETWLAEICDRLGENIEIMNVFIPFANSNYLPSSDTISAYNTALSLRKLMKDDGSNFEEAINKYASVYPLDKNNLKVGGKSWITSIILDPNYENIVYQLELGKVSQPIRTAYGYNIVKVLNRRPDIGIMRLSDIYMQYPQNATQAQKDSVDNLASTIYEKLINGADFDELYKDYTFDFDPTTKGDLGFFGVRRPLNPIFQNAIENIPVGGYSKPFLFVDGQHIIKITNKRNLGSCTDLRPEIIQLLTSTEFINTFYVQENKAAKERIAYSINQSVYNQLIALADSENLCEINSGKLSISLTAELLIIIGNNKYTVGDFFSFFNNNRKDICSLYNLSTDILYYGVNSYLYNILREEYKQQLLKNNTKLLNVAQEYYDGILYFNIMSDELWDKAQNDEQNLEQFYETHKSKYKWDDPRYEGYLIFVKDKETKKQVELIISKTSGNNNLASILKETLNNKDDVKVVVEKGFWAKGENQYIDALLYGAPTKKTFIGYPIFFFEGNKIEQPRNLKDVRGLVVSDYQSELDKAWVAKLRNKYEVIVNKKVLDNISKK